MSTAKIIATAYSPKRAIKPATNWPYHSQILSTESLYKDLIHKLAKLELNEDPGEPMDTFIIVYKDSWNVWKDWLQYDGKKTKQGTLFIVPEDEDGGCYLMYNKGFQMNKDKYEWFLITCDDVCILGQDYLVKIKAKWTDKAGYIALQGLNDSPHVQGSIGLTHRDILNKVCQNNNGELPHPKGKFSQERNISEGEHPFTNIIHTLGYKLIRYNNNDFWSRENLCMPYHDIRITL